MEGNADVYKCLPHTWFGFALTETISGRNALPWYGFTTVLIPISAITLACMCACTFRLDEMAIKAPLFPLRSSARAALNPSAMIAQACIEIDAITRSAAVRLAPCEYAACMCTNLVDNCTIHAHVTCGDHWQCHWQWGCFRLVHSYQRVAYIIGLGLVHEPTPTRDSQKKVP